MVQVHFNSNETHDLKYRNGAADRPCAAHPDTTGLNHASLDFKLFLAGGDLATLLDGEQIEVETTEPGGGDVE